MELHSGSLLFLQVQSHVGQACPWDWTLAGSRVTQNLFSAHLYVTMTPRPAAVRQDLAERDLWWTLGKLVDWCRAGWHCSALSWFSVWLWCWAAATKSVNGDVFRLVTETMGGGDETQLLLLFFVWFVNMTLAGCNINTEVCFWWVCFVSLSFLKKIIRFCLLKKEKKS